VSGPIEIVAAVIRDAAGRMLLVRKRKTRAFMQPGGKREAGEGDLVALARELREELGVVLVSALPVGTFRAPAAHETGREVVAAVYDAVIEGVPAARAEIAELLWLDPIEALPIGVDLAPLTRAQVLPRVRPVSAGARGA
jgi:8-oxo-dGTP diphosphatase